MNRVLLLGIDPAAEGELRTALASENCEISLAPDCPQALELTRAGIIDVVVLDFDVNPQALSHLARAFRSEEKLERILVLAGSLEQLILATETGADAALVNPWNRPRCAPRLMVSWRGLEGGARPQGGGPAATLLQKRRPPGVQANPTNKSVQSRSPQSVRTPGVMPVILREGRWLANPRGVRPATSSFTS